MAAVLIKYQLGLSGHWTVRARDDWSKKVEKCLVLSSLSLSPLREMKHKNNPGQPFPYWISRDDKVESVV